jgi:hypothetical protein
MENNNEAAKQEAKEQAKRAGRHTVHAAKNIKEAAKTAAAPAADAVVEGVHELGEEAAEKAKVVERAAKRIDTRVLGWMASDTGQGFLGVAVVVFAGGFAFRKFRAVGKGAEVLKEQVKGNHSVPPSIPDLPQ